MSPPNSFSIDEDTQPILTVEVPRSSLKTPPSRSKDPLVWIFGAMIVLSSCSLIFTTLVLAAPAFTSDTESIVPTSTITRFGITLVENDNVLEFETIPMTVGEFLKSKDVAVGELDRVSPPLDTILQPDTTIEIERLNQVEIIHNGNSVMLQTQHISPFDILEEAEILVDESDEVIVNGTAIPFDELASEQGQITDIAIQTTHQITVEDGDASTTFETSEPTIGDALFEEGITIYLADIVEPELSDFITEDVTVSIDRAVPIQFEVDGTVVGTRVQAETVADALEETGAGLFDMDYVVPEPETLISEDMTIKIIRVTEETESTTQTIPYETIYRDNPEMELDQYVVAQQGQNGVIQIDTQIRFEDGVEVGRSQSEPVTITPTQNQIIEYGTNIVIRTIDTPEGPREYWRKLTNMLTTSYHPAALGGDDRTAIGMKLEKGVIAGDPRIIPYRTNVFVPGYGLGVMGDTGGARSTRYWIDLGYSDEDWVSWLKRNQEIYLLTPVPADINYLLPNVYPDHVDR